jgi:L-lactate dehydrogenase
MKVAMVGVGRVGAASAFCIAQSGIADEILLLDIAKEQTEGEAEDIAQGIPLFPKSTKVKPGDYPDTEGSDLIIITAGHRRKPNESRLDLMKKNCSLVEEIVSNIVRFNRECILFVVTNPVDLLTYTALKVSEFEPRKVFGLGTYLDTVRLRSFIIREMGVRCPKAMMIGEHGDSMVLVRSGLDIPDSIIERTKRAGAEMIAKKGGAGWAVGVCIADVVRAVAEDSRKLFPLSVMLKDWQGFSGVCMSIPVVIGRSGIIEHQRLSLTEKERESFALSFEVIRGWIEKR